MGCASCKYWKGEEVIGVDSCTASQSFRDKFCGVGTNKYSERGSNFTPKKKKRRRK